MSVISSDLQSRLVNVDLSKTVGFFDLDLTLGTKENPDNPDETHIPRAGWGNLKRMACAGAKIICVTARGQETAHQILTEYGRIPNLIIASNSGHVVLENGQQRIIPIHGYTDHELSGVVKAMHFVADEMARRFTGTTIANNREMCAASIFKLPGRDTDAAFAAWNDTQREILGRLEPEVSNLITLSPKHWVAVVNGKLETHGYVDYKPDGMGKFAPTQALLREYMKGRNSDFTVIAAGDSMPDAEILRAVTVNVSPERRILVSVGDGLEQWGRDEGVHDLVVLHANGKHPVYQLHDLLAHVGTAAPSASARHGVHASLQAGVCHQRNG